MCLASSYSYSDIPIPTPDLFHDDGPCSQPSSPLEFNVGPFSQPMRLEANSNPFPTLSPTELYYYLTQPLSHSFDQIVILDARFDYEYKGGHIEGAQSIRSRSDMIRVFEKFVGQNVCFVFHCEFSMNRGPTLMKMFREYDRYVNYEYYPDVTHKNIYLLEGGYSRFYKEYPVLCTGGYTKMRETQYVNNGELRKSHTSFSKEMIQYGRRPLRRHKSMHMSSFNLLQGTIL